MNEQKAIDILQRAFDETIQVDEASQFLSSLDGRTEKKLCEIVHAAVHFVTDRDIRQVDKEYDRLQRESLYRKLKILQESHLDV